MPKLRNKNVRNKQRTYRAISRPKTADEFFAQPEQFQTEWEQALRVISKMRSGGLSLKKAAKQEGVNPRTVTHLGGRALKKGSNGRYYVSRRDSLLRVLQIPTADGMREIAIRNSSAASTVGQYSAAVQKYLRTGDSSEVSKFRGRRIKDANGTQVPLITDIRELNRLGSAGVLSFESIYARVA
jgi:hypothetical protein